VRKTERFPTTGPNALWQVYRTVSKWKAMRNFVFIQITRYSPSLRLKNWIYRHVLGMKVGKHASFALMVMPDVFFPEKISVGNNSIIGYNSTILCHEYLIHEYRLGEVHIGADVMIGANSTVLPGVTIGDGAVIGAGSVVHKDVEPGSFVAGNPLRVIRPGTGGGRLEQETTGYIDREEGSAGATGNGNREEGVAGAAGNGYREESNSGAVGNSEHEDSETGVPGKNGQAVAHRHIDG
jgi:acetyltransferase-like isoleucine patch superfamily enzyme